MIENLRQWGVFTIAPLRSTLFLFFWMAGLANNLGGIVRSIAASWYMVSMTDSAVMVTLVQTAISLPLTLFALLAGALADLYDRRVQMIAALSFCAVAATSLFISAVVGTLTPGQLLLFTFLIGSGTAFYVPAFQSSVIDMVKPSNLGQAVSLNNLSSNITLSAGPAIGAEIIAAAGVVVAFFANAVSYLGLIVTLALWKRPSTERALPRETLGRAMIDGLRYVGMSPFVRGSMVRGFMLAFGCAGLMSLPPIIATDLGGGPRALGALLSGFGVGAMSGSLVAARLRLMTTANRLEVGATSIVAMSLLVLAVSNWLWLATLIMVVAGSAWAVAVSTLQVSVHTSCPRWVLGRALSIFMMTFYLGVAGGAVVAGVIANIASASTALLFEAAFLGVAILLAKIVAIADAQLAELEPYEELKLLPETNLDPRSGPVVVTIYYRVPPDNAEMFMDAMYSLRRVRRRDGARNWSLTQDIDDTELWLERFQSPTWTDYLHRVSRKVVADQPLHRQVRELCAAKPVSHRRLERPVGSKPLPAVTSDQSLLARIK